MAKIKEIKRYQVEFTADEFEALRMALTLVANDYEPSETLDGLLSDFKVRRDVLMEPVADEETNEALPDKAIRVSTAARTRRKGRLGTAQD